MRLFAVCLMMFAALGSCLAQENLTRNASFEEVLEGKIVAWSERPGEQEVRLMTDGGHDGDNYVRFIDEKATEGIFLLADTTLSRPGGTYTATAWFRTSDKCSPGVYLNFYDDMGTRVHNLFSRASGPTDGWVQVTVTSTAPPEAVEVCVGVYAYGGDVGTFDADDLTMTVQGGSEPGSAGVERAQPGDKTVEDIDSRLELFVDDFIIDGTSGSARRLLHHPIAQEVTLQFDKPWEGPYCGYVAVMNDEGKTRIYYRGWPNLEGRDCTCVIESEDGINFTRPNLGIYEWEGSKENNIVWMGPGCHNFTPFKDENPNAPADQKYKALASAGPKSSLVPFVSADGLHWTMLQKEPVITEGAFDSQNLAFWDPVHEEYREYHRGFKDGVRDIMTSTSKDFITWTDPVWLDYGDAPREHLYTNAALPYFRAPQIQIAFPCRFVPGRKKVASHKEEGINDGVLMSSRDGLHWQRWIEAFLRPGPDEKTWTDRNNYIAWGIAPTSESEISLYWSEHYRYPTYRLRRGTVRMDGFVSVNADAAGGEILTRPLVFSGSKLIVNYDTSAAGIARFELCDEAGTPHDGFQMGQSEKLFGSEIAHTVTWDGNADVSSLAGKPVRLRVRLKDADLYSFKFEE